MATKWKWRSRFRLSSSQKVGFRIGPSVDSQCLYKEIVNTAAVAFVFLVLFEFLSMWYFPKDGLPTTLQELYITSWRRLEFLNHEVMTKLTFLVRLKISNSCDSLRYVPLGILPKLDQDTSHSLGRDRWWSDGQIMSSQSHTQFLFWFHALLNQSQVCGTMNTY
jgi:hypothetical protein